MNGNENAIRVFDGKWVTIFFRSPSLSRPIEKLPHRNEIKPKLVAGPLHAQGTSIGITGQYLDPDVDTDEHAGTNIETMQLRVIKIQNYLNP